MTFTIDETALRDCASALAGTGARVAAGAAQPPPAVVVPRWAASDAVRRATEAAQDALTGLGGAVQAAGDLIGATAGDYRAADERAARRLRAVR
jgi:hypothetical protein